MEAAQCQICRRKFSSARALEGHRNAATENGRADACQNLRENGKPCRHCSGFYLGKSNFNRHERECKWKETVEPPPPDILSMSRKLTEVSEKLDRILELIGGDGADGDGGGGFT